MTFFILRRTPECSVQCQGSACCSAPRTLSFKVCSVAASNLRRSVLYRLASMVFPDYVPANHNRPTQKVMNRKRQRLAASSRSPRSARGIQSTLKFHSGVIEVPFNLPARSRAASRLAKKSVRPASRHDLPDRIFSVATRAPISLSLGT